MHEYRYCYQIGIMTYWKCFRCGLTGLRHFDDPGKVTAHSTFADEENECVSDPKIAGLTAEELLYS